MIPKEQDNIDLTRNKIYFLPVHVELCQIMIPGQNLCQY